MSIKSSFREALDRREGAKEKRPVRSGSPIRFLIKAERDIPRPVDVARLLGEHGLSLRAAHTKLDALARGQVVAVELRGDNPDLVTAELSGLGLSAAQILPPDVSVKHVREHSGLSQADFAVRFGFGIDTIQNWEQGRNSPDFATKVLLSIIERQPRLVDAALTGWRVISYSPPVTESSTFAVANIRAATLTQTTTRGLNA